jgi:hypothetical protein
MVLPIKEAKTAKQLLLIFSLLKSGMSVSEIPKVSSEQPGSLALTRCDLSSGTPPAAIFEWTHLKGNAYQHHH